jgi:hypothetical protein
VELEIVAFPDTIREIGQDLNSWVLSQIRLVVIVNALDARKVLF